MFLTRARFGLTLVLLSPGLVGAQALSAADRLARDILEELVEINTTDSVGNTTLALSAGRQGRRTTFC